MLVIITPYSAEFSRRNFLLVCTNLRVQKDIFALKFCG